MKRDLYAEATARIVAELEAGAAPWVKPWRATAGNNSPANAATNRPYSGCNIVMLWMAQAAHGWATPRFLTFKQAKELGGNVRKGEHGSMVFFVKKLTREELPVDAETGEGETRTFTMMRAYTVFNVAQCENLPARCYEAAAIVARNPGERAELADAFLEATGADIREGAGEAYFAPGRDFISLPAFANFISPDHFYGVAFHELAHWTGAKSRLARDLEGRFGDRKYAAEELVAELCAAFLCAEFDINGELRHAAYIESWLKLLKDDSRAFFTAAAKAQQAADYLRGLALADRPAIAA